MCSRTAKTQTSTAQEAVLRKDRGSRRGSVANREVPGILVEERTFRFARGRERGKLYVVVEMAGEAEGNETIAGHLAHVIAEAYFDQRRSVTSGLQEAIREANALLYDQNQDALPEERLTAGVSCALLRGPD